MRFRAWFTGVEQMSDDFRFSRIWAMPSEDTFSIPPIQEFVKRWLLGKIETVDPFARNSRLAKYRNDLNRETASEHHMQAGDFLKLMREREVKAEVVILDPPYSPRQISECYKSLGITPTMEDTQNSRFIRELKDAAHAVTDPGSVILSFGWNSSGMGETRGYDLLEILLVCHGGAHNDTICIAERRREENQIRLL